MTQRSATGNLIRDAEADGLVLFALGSALPKGGDAPEWITLFPRLGRIETRDSRVYEVDAATLMAAFAADALEIPVDVNHATDTSAYTGQRSDAIGWVVELRESAGTLQARVEWLEEGKALLAARKYRYVSPSFYRDDLGRATRLKAVGLVTAPALGRMPALAGAKATDHPETSMKAIATALGLAEGADEAACLAALKTNVVPKTVHDEALAKLSSTSTELAALKGEQRKAKVDALLEGALAAKKIVPAQREHYATLCTTDEGLASVEKLFAATTPGLTPSDLDRRQAPGGGDKTKDPQALAAAAVKEQADQLAAGRTISTAEAMTIVTARAA